MMAQYEIMCEVLYQLSYGRWHYCRWDSNSRPPAPDANDESLSLKHPIILFLKLSEIIEYRKYELAKSVFFPNIKKDNVVCEESFQMFYGLQTAKKLDSYFWSSKYFFFMNSPDKLIIIFI